MPCGYLNTQHMLFSSLFSSPLLSSPLLSSPLLLLFSLLFCPPLPSTPGGRAGSGRFSIALTVAVRPSAAPSPVSNGSGRYRGSDRRPSLFLTALLLFSWRRRLAAGAPSVGHCLLPSTSPPAHPVLIGDSIGAARSAMASAPARPAAGPAPSLCRSRSLRVDCPRTRPTGTSAPSGREVRADAPRPPGPRRPQFGAKLETHRLQAGRRAQPT